MDSNQVSLPTGQTGSSFFYRVLKTAADRYSLPLPDKDAFKHKYGDAVVRFEAARLASPERIAIARHLAGDILAHLLLDGRPLLEALREQAPLPTLQTFAAPASMSQVEVPFDGRIYRGRDIGRVIDTLFDAHQMSRAAADGLRWMVQHLDANGGTLDLRGHSFVLLGAGAELSPAKLLLDAGARVLWIDSKPPRGLAGELCCAADNDLLSNPRAVIAAIRRFAESSTVHMLLLGYAPGKGREIRLTGVMNGLIHTLGPEVVRSVSMLISPTSPAELQPEDQHIQNTRKLRAWHRALDLSHVLTRPNHLGGVVRAIVSLQGPGYQAAQYLAKIVSAEALACDGLGGQPLAVSANVAGISNTRSMSHPLFQLAFVGAPLFGVRIFEPATTRVLSALLMLHDLLNPNSPANKHFPSPLDKARAIHAEQIHGGVYTVPWHFEPAVRVAAVVGMGLKPSLLLPKRFVSRRPRAAHAHSPS